jgi:hypothetical protein
MKKEKKRKEKKRKEKTNVQKLCLSANIECVYLEQAKK